MSELSDYSTSDVAFDVDDDDDIVLDSASELSAGPGDATFDSVETTKPPAKSYQVEYRVLSPEDLALQQEEAVNYVASLTALEPQKAGLLLRYYGWNRDKLIERYMENSEKCVADAGIDSSSNSQTRVRKRLRGFLCEVCFDEGSSKDTVSLACNHRFCRDCYVTYLETKINEQGEARQIQCMESKCPLVMGESIIETLVSSRTMEKYRRLLNRAYVDDDPRLRWCPAPNCSYTIKCNISSRSLTSVVPTVQCLCGRRFCFGCGLDDHQPCICVLVKLWLKKCADDSETANWMSANTKECPKCHATIEKSGGCNHMTCKKCRHEFCWVCMGLWSAHGTSWYNCSRYDEGQKSQEDLQSKSRVQLERYLFYYNRYANHEQSAKLEQDVYLRTEKKMEEIQASSDMSWIEVQFMKRALDTLSSCRATLKWTYAMTFFLEKDNATFIFEENQNDLEQKVEALSELLERPLEEDTLAELRQDITNRTVYVAKRHEVLLEDTARGHAEDRWIYNVDVNA